MDRCAGRRRTSSFRRLCWSRGLPDPQAGCWCGWLPCGRTGLSVSFRVFGVSAYGSARLLWVVVVLLGGVIVDDVPDVCEVATDGCKFR